MRVVAILLLSAVLILSYDVGWAGKYDIRKPVVADQFYSGDRYELSTYLAKLLDRTPKEKTEGELLALIVPHAGYFFSGGVAAYGYKELEGLKFDTVIIVGLSHKVPLLFEASIYPRGKYKTPLGLVEIDEKLARRIKLECPSVKFVPEAHLREHSIEVQLPFLQTVLEDKFKMVPILINDPSEKNYRSLGHAIVKASEGKKVLLIASADMSHYPPWKDAYNVDLDTLQVVEKFDPPRLARYMRKKMKEGISGLQCIFCADAAVLTVMAAAKEMGGNKVFVLKYANSGDVWAKSRTRVVGYCAVAFTRKEKKAPGAALFDPKTLTKKDKRKLLSLARASIEQVLKFGRMLELPSRDEKFNKRAAVFVTLRKNYWLRGCIGQTEALLPLDEAVRQMAIAAAFQDYRFKPVSKGELKAINVEISVLSPLKRVYDPTDIILGIHGVAVKKGDKSGLFLPHVAKESGWKKEEFLNRLCAEKAGLPKNAWKDPATELYVFTAEVFHE